MRMSPIVSTSVSAGIETTWTSRVVVRFEVNTPGRRTLATSFHVTKPPSLSNDAGMCDGISKEMGNVYVPALGFRQAKRSDTRKATHTFLKLLPTVSDSLVLLL